jgi:hypothetical protein
MFPVQTNRTLFTTRCVPRSRTHWQSKFVERQVNAWDWRCDSRRLDFLVLAREKKTKVRGDYKRSWMSDDYCDLIVWYEPGNAIHGFQLCYGKPQSEHALTWLRDRGFAHHEVDPGEDAAEWNLSPILVPDGEFPAEKVISEFEQRAIDLPKSLRNFVIAKLHKFATNHSTRPV